MNLNHPITDDWKRWFEENMSRGCDKLRMFNQSVKCGVDPKESRKILGIMRDAEWLETDKCLLLKKKNFLTSEECKIVIQDIETDNIDSTVTGSNDNFRQSKTKHFMKLKWLDEKFHDFMGSKESFSEGTQGTMYNPGGFFKIHGDYFNHSAIEENLVWDYSIRGQRTWTALLYLNTSKDGGGKTSFPHLIQTFTPEEGTLVCWYNLLPNEDINKNTEHIAEPVKSVKFVVQKWYRQKEYFQK